MNEEEKKAIDELIMLKHFLETEERYEGQEREVNTIKIVLKLITKLQKENEEKDRKMKKYLDIISKNIIETIKDELVQQKNKELDFKDKQIDLMAEVIFKRFTAELVIEYGIENKEQFIKLFEEKARNNY